MATGFPADQGTFFLAINERGLLSSISSRKRRRRKFEMEFLKPALDSSPDLSQEVRSWLRSLPPAALCQAFTIQHAWLAAMIRQMYTTLLKEGEGKFLLIEDNEKAGESECLNDYFYFRKQSVVRNMSLEKWVRLCDSDDYLDTLTLNIERKDDLESILKSLDEISKSRVFKSAIKATFDSDSKIWMWECPGWFNSREFHSFDAFLAVILEKSVWINFYHARRKDPRKDSETQLFSWDARRHFKLNEELVNFWEGLEHFKKDEILGDLETIVKSFQQERQEIKELSRNKLGPFGFLSNYINENSYVAYTHESTFNFEDTQDRYSSIRTEVRSFQVPGCIFKLTEIASFSSAYEFIGFLYLSPLNRAGTMLDIISRRIAQRLTSSFTEKIAEDLILTEEAETIKKQVKMLSREETKKKRKHAKGKKKRKLSNASAVSASTTASAATTLSSTCGDEEAEVHYINKLVAGLFKELYNTFEKEVIQEASELSDPEPPGSPQTPCLSPTLQIPSLILTSKDEEFSLVNSKSKKKSIKKNSKHKSRKTKKPKKSEKDSEPHKPVPKEDCTRASASSSRKVFSSKPQPSSSRLSNFDFPPLTHAVHTSHELHSLILNFSSNISNKLSLYSGGRYMLIEKINEVINSIFPMGQVQLYGSYATGLALISSDIDICVVGSGLSGSSSIKNAISEMGRVISGYHWVMNCQPIPTASVPVVKLTVDTGYFSGVPDTLKVDITIEDEIEGSCAGLASLFLTRELLILYPYLQPIVLVIKQLLANNSLNIPYLGGLSSYSIIIWTVALMNSLSEPPINAGELLTKFLRFYGRDFKPDEIGINIVNGG